ncbi:hypothetical protein [Thiolinea disciformis]|uniref:hypothetical protein n=1 Tax=Thiolinea disciformis TaxID=125614 RepID=UPI000364EDE8|nr:hypothetical protein [Thiolinea disciformis]
MYYRLPLLMIVSVIVLAAPASIQAVVSSHLPASLQPSGVWELKSALSADFNQDKQADWVVVAYRRMSPEWFKHQVSIYMSQPNGTYQRVVNSSFDPSDSDGDAWRVDARLLAGNELYISNNTTNPFSSRNYQNSYKLRWLSGRWVLREYSFGYGSSTGGSTIVADLVQQKYRKLANGRCDYTPDHTCRGAKVNNLVRVPTIILRDSDFVSQPKLADLSTKQVDNVRVFERFLR